jgi:hypothetical protein
VFYHMIPYLLDSAKCKGVFGILDLKSYTFVRTIQILSECTVYCVHEQSQIRIFSQPCVYVTLLWAFMYWQHYLPERIIVHTRGSIVMVMMPKSFVFSGKGLDANVPRAHTQCCKCYYA